MRQFLLTTFFPVLTLTAFVIPAPSGPYGVSIQDVLITDHNLPDPYLNLSYRRVPASVISQAGSSGTCEPVLQQYLPNITAVFWEKAFIQTYGLPIQNTFTQTQLILCKPVASRFPAPVILFGPGAGISRYFYNIMGSMITAKTGWTVITFDIPGQTEIEEFPDGSVEYAAPSTEGPTFTNAEAVGNVTQNAMILLNALMKRNSTAQNITSCPSLGPALEHTSQVAIMGHSQGGAAALQALIGDDRVSSGLNLDGGLNASAFLYLANPQSNRYTTSKPFATFMHNGETQFSDFSWPIVWNHVLRGTKWEFRLDGSQHDGYSDFGYLVDLYGIRQEQNVSSRAIDALFGSQPGPVVLEIVRDVAAEFFKYGFGMVPATNVDRVVNQFEEWGLDIVNRTIV